MLATMPVDAALAECEARPYTLALHADAAKKALVHLPPGAIFRKCPGPGEASQVLTRPDSGGTEVCVAYEFGVNAKDPEVQATPQKTAVARSLKNKECPAIDYRRQSYPGKDWFFLSDGVPLENAFKVKARVETGGIAFLLQEKKAQKDRKGGVDFGNSPLGVYSISVAPTMECRDKGAFFQQRLAACYKVGIYNQAVREGWSVNVGLRKNGAYDFIRSTRTGN